MKKQLGSFEIGEQIDPGGHTLVYHAVEEMGHGIQRPAAVKVLKSIKSDDEDAMESLVREARILIEVSTSPNIVTVYGFGIDDEVGPWISMELAGRSLRHFITDEPTDPEQVRLFLRDSLRGLAVVHSKGILHRDLKPNNILTSDFGSWQLADFGLAKLQNSEDTLELMTAQYAAPEMFDPEIGEESPRMDIYSLGLAAYEFALGTKLYRQQFPSVFDPQARGEQKGDLRPKWMYWHTSLQMTVPPIKEVIEDFPADLSDLIASMTAKPMRERLTDAAQGLASIGDVTAQVPQPMYAQADEPTSSGNSAVKTLLGILALLVVLAGGALFVMSQIGEIPVISVASGSEFRSNTALISVTGKIDQLPKGADAMVRLSPAFGGTSTPVALTTDGSFSADVLMNKIGRANARVEVRSRGTVIASKALTIQRDQPEKVLVIVETVPRTPNSLVIFLTTEGEEIERMRTDHDGLASTDVPFGQAKILVEHPLFLKFRSRPFTTGIKEQREVSANLKALSEEGVARAKEDLLSKIEDAKRRLAAGDPKAAEELKRLFEDAGEAFADDPELAAAIQDAISGALNGDEGADEALAKAIADTRANEAKKERERRGILASTGDDGKEGKPAPTTIAEATAALVNDMAATTARLLAGDPAAVDELAAQVEKMLLIEGDPDPNDPLAMQKHEAAMKLKDAIERFQNGDPTALADIQKYQKQLEVLDQMQRAKGDPEKFEEMIAKMGAAGFQILDQELLWKLPPEQLRMWIFVNVPNGALSVEVVPPLSKVRVRGPVFSQLELRRLVTRLALAAPRIEFEVDVEPWAVCRRLAERLTEEGARDVHTQPYLAEAEEIIYVLSSGKDDLDEDQVSGLAAKFVLNPDVLRVQEL